MKLTGKKVCAAFLSIGIVAGSIVVPSVYAAENKEFATKAAIDNSYNPSFMVGELSGRSAESPEKIVEKNYGKLLKGLENSKQKSFKQNRKFKNSAGRTVISTSQTFNGVRVYGTEQNFHINDDGVIECIAGSNIDDIENKVKSVNFSAKYTQNDVLSAVEKHLGFAPKYESAPQPEIILYPVSGKYNYVYEVKIKSVSPYYKNCTYYVNTDDLSVINVNNHIAAAEQAELGTGIGQLNKLKPLQIVKDDSGTYFLKNSIENFSTYSGYLDRSLNVIPGPVISEPDNNFDSSQEDAVDAHSNVTKVSKFFSNAPFYRKGEDDKDSNIMVCVVSSRIPNAYGAENYIELHTAKSSSGVSASYALDIVAHEFTHGMLYSEGLYGVQAETGALHEGLADVFGILAEYYIPNDYTEIPFAWLHGEDFSTDFRDCANPPIDDYNDYINQNADAYGGAGVISKAAYLMAMGGTHNGISVNATGYDKLARIFYNALNDGYITNDTSLKQFANYAVQAANLLYGPNSQAYKSTIDAFIAVGLLNPAPARFRLMYVSDMNVQLSWEAPSGSRIGVYRKGAGNKGEPVRIATTTSTTGQMVSTVVGSCDFYIAYLDAAGNRISAYSNAVNVSKLTKSAPTNFRITYRGGLSVQFSWSGTTGSKYAVYRKISGSNDEFLKVGETTSTTMSVGTLLGKCDFKVAVVSVDGIRLSPYSNVYSVESFTTAPANFRLTSSTSTTAEFSWNEEASGNRYAVYRLIPGSLDMPEKVSETRDTSLTVNLTPGTYDYQVAMVDLEGNRMSGFSNIVPVSR